MMNEWYKFMTNLDLDEDLGRTERPTGRSNTPDISTDRQEYRIHYWKFKEKVIGTHLLIARVIYDKEHHSSTSLKHLTRTTISDLQLDTPAKGTYLLLRTLEPAFRGTGFHTFVEDHAGNGIVFCAYNVLTTDDCQEVFPVGIVFIVKEPLLAKSVTGRYILECCSPTDIVILQEGHKYYYLTKDIVWKNEPSTRPYPDSEYEKQKSADEWKTLGNEMFKKRKFIHATRFYCKGLHEAEKAIDTDLCQVLHLNLSAAYLNSGWYESALNAAEKALEINRFCLKAHFRAGRANYELRKYAESKQWFCKLLENFPDCKEAKNEFERCQSRLEEAECGTHSIYQMVLKRTCQPRQAVDCADYIGPIRMVNSPGKVRGYVATKDLNPGTLVLVSKALKAVWWKDISAVEQTFNEPEIENTMIINELTSVIANTLLKNPNTFISSFYSLSAGTFGTGGDETVMFCDSQLKEEPVVDVERIRHIIVANSYRLDGWPDERCSTLRRAYSICPDLPEFLGRNFESGKGVFIPASLFHRRCVSNAVYEIYNDVMFIRAIEPIKEGEEIFLPGCPPETPYTERLGFYERLGYHCDCPACLVDGKELETFRTQRHDLIYTFVMKTILGHGSLYQTILDLKKVIEEVKITYRRSNRKEFQWDLAFLYLLLAFFLGRYELYDEEIQALINIFRTVGFEPDELLTEFNETNTVSIKKSQFLSLELIACLDPLSQCYLLSGDIPSAKKWIRIMIAFDRIFTGTDLKSFKVKYPNVKKLCDNLDI